MENTRNVHQSREEVERYTNALGSLIVMRRIYNEVRTEGVESTINATTMECNYRERRDRIARHRFIERCKEADINALPYLNGVTIRRAINVISSEIRSFKYALSQFEDNDQT